MGKIKIKICTYVEPCKVDGCSW